MQNTHMTMLLPDAFLLLAIILAWLNDIVTGATNLAGRRATYLVAVISSLLAALGYLLLAAHGQSHYFFDNMYVIDPFANLMKAAVTAGFAIALIYSRKYLEERGLFRGDFYLLAMFSLLGQLVMISGHNFLILYLGLELMSLSLYALIALRPDTTALLTPATQSVPKLATEAAMKYYVLGALASGFLLYGISMLYGATSSLDLDEVFRAIASGRINYTVLLFGVVFIVVGIAFKLGAVPFHMWVPDVYQGAPTAMTLLIGGGPKVAAFAWGLRLLVIGLLPLAIDWQQMLVILAALSLVIGNLVGIAQKNIKRMLAYSAISNMGFVLLALLSGVVGGKLGNLVGAYSSATFYSIIYLLTTLGSFGVVMLLARRDFEVESIDAFKGLNQRSPLFALVMLVMMFSLAGLPPTVGFYAKFAVLEAAMNAGLTWLVVLAVLSSLLGAFYYLRIVKLMYFDAPLDQTPLVAYTGARIVLVVNGFALLALGLMPGPLMSLCMRVLQQTLLLP
ncbi:NADH-quinone oxidoreductase subunit NuoN [Mycoavidus sp. HKI]|uniref:NADH-quinone oxidoreductase subunit NuoN n=1 Tax=Mycoavidus sp. HKI TaxID=2840467 RepID=UPI001CBDD7A1|nr:NADH-quinone oxidoreductase subunit NuoN [Mycoavidus sp. HKI]UAW63641.1 NADH-quinone oxidoreductase subunit NuoN [Mycoavidus sp. HKI]